MDCYTRYSMNMLYEEARKCYVNMTSSKVLGVKITPEYVGPLPPTKRERHPRKCKKEAFNYKTNTFLPSNHLKFEYKNCPLCLGECRVKHLCVYEDESCPECSKKE